MNTLKRFESFESSELTNTSRTPGSRSARSSFPEWAAVRMNGRSRLTTAGEAREPLARVAFPQQCPVHTSPKLFVTTTRKTGRFSRAAFAFASFSVGSQSSS